MRALALILLLLASTAQAAPKVASFGIELINTSLEPTRPDETARVALVEQQLAAAMTERGYMLLDTGPVAERAGQQDLRSCLPCEMALADELGADLAMLGWVQKVSNLILNINLAVHEVPSGRLVGAGSVDIRSNTDESWSRGLKALLERRVFPALEQLAE